MLTAKDIMTKDVITVKPDATVKELAKLLTEHKISGVPVVDEDGNIVGIVTENDLVSRNKRLHIPTVLRLFDAYFVLGSGKVEEEMKKMTALLVDGIFTKEVVSIKEETPLQAIATIMSEKNIHLLPVLKGKSVVGIVGKADIVRAMA